MGIFYRHLAIFSGHTVYNLLFLNYSVAQFFYETIHITQRNVTFVIFLHSCLFEIHLIVLQWMVFINQPSSASFLFIFGLFQTNKINFTTNLCEKCPSSIRCLDSNSRPWAYESPPLTTRPRLPSFAMIVPCFSDVLSIFCINHYLLWSVNNTILNALWS